jgi:hypothetical protein
MKGRILCTVDISWPMAKHMPPPAAIEKDTHARPIEA